MTQCPDLAEQWTERRHAAEAFLREFLDEQYPISPDESDPWRRRVEASLARRAEPPWPLSAQEAADYLEARFLVRFPDADEVRVEWREVRGVRGLRIQWAWGPSWLPVRAWADNFAAVRVEGLHAPVEHPGAVALADFIYVVRHKDHVDDTVETPWADWGHSEGPWSGEWEEMLGPASDAASGTARTPLDLPRPWQEAFDVAEQAWRQGTQD